jgi:prolipoprotein diacylglyceryltransferase
MKQNKYFLGFFLLCLPFSSYASGQSVLTLIGLELVLIIIFIILLLTLKINLKGKGILIFIFLLTHLAIYKFIEELPYTENQILINSITIGIPVLSILISYLIIRKKYEKKSTKS